MADPIAPNQALLAFARTLPREADGKLSLANTELLADRIGVNYDRYEAAALDALHIDINTVRFDAGSEAAVRLNRQILEGPRSYGARLGQGMLNRVPARAAEGVQNGFMVGLTTGVVTGAPLVATEAVTVPFFTAAGTAIGGVVYTLYGVGEAFWDAGRN
jgi:hypothetical protein